MFISFTNLFDCIYQINLLSDYNVHERYYNQRGTDNMQATILIVSQNMLAHTTICRKIA